MRTLQHGNWYQGARWVTVSREKKKIEKIWEVVGWVLGQVILKIFFFLISNLH